MLQYDEYVNALLVIRTSGNDSNYDEASVLLGRDKKKPCKSTGLYGVKYTLLK